MGGREEGREGGREEGKEGGREERREGRWKKGENERLLCTEHFDQLTCKFYEFDIM